MLEAEDSLGIEQVRLSLAPPLVLAAHVEPAVRRADARRRVRRRVAARGLLGDDVEAHAAEPGSRFSLEAHRFGCTHADVTASLALHWHFPPALVAAAAISVAFTALDQLSFVATTVVPE